MLPRMQDVPDGVVRWSLMAAHAGLPISQPVDVIYDARFDLLKKENSDRLEQVIKEDDPLLLAVVPVCGPWCMWRKISRPKTWRPGRRSRHYGSSGGQDCEGAAGQRP